MLASVYAVLAGGRWRAVASVAPAVDLRYWLDESFAAGVLEAAGEAAFACAPGAAPGGGAAARRRGGAAAGVRPAAQRQGREAAADDGASPRPGTAAALLLWREQLPLGEAFRAAELFEARRRGGRARSEREAVRLLGACIAAAAGRRDAGRRAGSRAAQAPSPRAIRRCARPGGGGRGAAQRASAQAEAWALASAALQAAEALQGRALLRSEAHALLGAAGPAAADWSAVCEALQLAALLGRLRLGGAVAAAEGRRWALPRRRRRCRCQRCGSGEERLRRTQCAACGRECAYCEACLTMGRSRECELLVLGVPRSVGSRGTQDRRQAAPERAVTPAAPAQRRSGVREPHAAADPLADRLAKWSLSPAQTEAVGEALAFMEETDGRPARAGLGMASEKADRRFLLWAVTGAGKTEMIFPLIETALLRGGRALVATPRRDVVLELDPRIRRAFPERTVVTLYGGSEQRWERGEITLATTHQLMRFSRAFELVVIDELDAFPYHGDPILHYTADRAGTERGVRILLSATPPAGLRREAARAKLRHAKIPVRYHRHPLPVPRLLRTPSVSAMIGQGNLPAALREAVLASVRRGAQLFVFVQQIRQTAPVAALLAAVCPAGVRVGHTSSQDGERADKVMRFRDRDIRILVTTTILERGVTVPRSDVFILDADGRLFDEASLVQMAGRAGRSADDPFGRVYFCSPARSRSQLAAVRQIKGMNRLAGRKGYLRTPDEQRGERS